MAILHRKEEKIQVVLGRLPKQYTHDQFIEMFIKLYSKDWGKIKSAYIKQSQDKEPGTVINMPKPDLYLKQVLEAYLMATPAKPDETVKSIAQKEETPAIKAKTASKKAVTEVAIEKPAKTVTAASKKNETIETATKPIKEAKTTVKKKPVTEKTTAQVVKEVKKKAPFKKKADSEETSIKVKPVDK